MGMAQKKFKMRYFLLILISIASILFFSFKPVSAESDYVLPYPSSMPGSKLYKMRLIWEEVIRYWHFGNLSQFKYNLNQADKYLVEAKTLFEYKQYLLAKLALEKSDNYIIKAKEYLAKSKEDGKNIEQKQIMFENANLKHIEVLNFIKTIIPDNFLWSPEKVPATNLDFKKALDESIKIRKQG